MKTDRLCEIEKFNDEITLCFVEIKRIADAFLPEQTDNEHKRAGSVLVPLNGVVRETYSGEELEKINRFKIFKKQAEWMAGRYAVKQLVYESCGVLPYNTVVDAEKEGAPYIRGRKNSPLTISHSGAYAIAGISRNVDRLIGIDIEKIEQGRMDTIKRVAFTDKEIESVASENTNKALYINWTIKEAYLKFIKKGFHEGLKNVEIINKKVFHHGVEQTKINIHSSLINDEYAYSLVY